MSQTEQNNPTVTESTAFISSATNAKTDDGGAYSDFFQETSDGNISIGRKAQKSGLEIATTLFGYTLPFIIVGVIIGSLHVYLMKGGGAQQIKDNYTFLCRYINHTVDVTSDEDTCETLVTIEQKYAKKKAELQDKITDKLNEYIPLKLTKNLLATSPERSFAESMFKKKIHMNEIMDQFDRVVQEAKSPGITDEAINNISCNGMSVNSEGILTSQCVIGGDVSGKDDSAGNMGSSRIETIRFLNLLGDTATSQFLLMNYPTSLSMEKDATGKYPTRTTVSIQAKYVILPSTK